VLLRSYLRDLLSRWRRYSENAPAKSTLVSVLLASMGVSALVLGLRHWGVLQPMELWAYDQLLRSRPVQPPDSRILVVQVTEGDLQRVRKFPLPDEVLATTLEKLQQYQPSAIGLDIYRDLPVQPGHDRLQKIISKSDRLITICKLTNATDPGVAPPSTAPSDLTSFSDVPIDPDGIIRRVLLFAGTDRGKCRTPFSFSFQLARKYLEGKGIQPSNRPSDKQLLFGNVLIPPITSNSGSYANIDARGYQILLNYRGNSASQAVTLGQILDNKIKPEWVRDRIVLIGTTAPSVRDLFNTPYTAAGGGKMPGVVIHAQVVSQILGAAIDKKPLFRYMPEWAEMLWVWAWSFAGGLIAWKLRHPWRLGLAEGAALSSLTGICYGLLVLVVWVPIIPAAVALVATGATVVVSVAYQIQQQQQQIGQLAQEQEQTIALLTTMLKEGTQTFTTPNMAEAPTQQMEGAQTEVLPQLPIRPLTPLPTPAIDGRYQIVRVLGQGGFGQTYLAEDTKRPGKPTCVVKYLMPARRDAKFLQVAQRLFETEAKILEALGQNSPQIPQLLAYFAENEEFYLVEEYIEGLPLSEELLPEKRLSEVQVWEILTGVLEVLGYIHKHHVIHRDIKPSNIIRSSSNGLLVLIDFGAVKQMHPHSEDQTENQTIAIGTRGYAPPEQYAGHPRANSDIFALGMIAIQALTGILPQSLSQDPDTGNVQWRHLAKLNPEFGEIIDKMVRYHFSDRYHSALEVLGDLNQLDRSLLGTQPSDLRIVSSNTEIESLDLSQSQDSTVVDDLKD
jgi:CHASE2 domain-containing sensor protein/tRNA A-37 threonylcarbamoyl transferase component Bud32